MFGFGSRGSKSKNKKYNQIMFDTKLCIEKLTTRLKELSDKQVGDIVANATHIKNGWLSEGEEIFSLYYGYHNMKQVDKKERMGIAALQKGLNEVYLGMMVVVYTIRAHSDTVINKEAIEMWKQLERGFPCVTPGILKKLNVEGIEDLPNSLKRTQS